MKEAAVYFICVITVIAFSSFVSYSGEEACGGSFALGIILAAALLSPLSKIPLELSLNINNAPSELPSDISSDVVLEAYCEGVSYAIADKFGLNEEKIRIGCRNFSAEKMSADEIVVTLYGECVYADLRGIREYTEKICKCSVVIDTWIG